MSIQVSRPAVPSRPETRRRPAWLDFCLSVIWVLRLAFSLLGAILQGFLLGESDPEKYRPLAPKERR